VLLAVAVLVLVLSVPLAGGRLGALVDLRFRGVPLLLGALGLQLLIFDPGPITGGVAWQAAHLGSYVLVGAFVVRNREIPFLWLVALGGLLNLTAIAANGGVMPARAEAVATAGLAAGKRMANSAVLPHPRLAFLGDIFAVPSGWPLSNVFSIGDLCLVLGTGLLLHRATGSRLVPRVPSEQRALRRNPAFVRLWLAQAVSGLGDWLYAITAVTVVARAGGGPETLGLLLALQLAPSALVGLLGGALVDRVSRRGIMVTADLVRGGAVATLLLGGAPSVAHLAAVAVVLGGAGALFNPSLQAALPDLVARDHLVAANAVLNATFTFAVTAGPLLGGFVVAQLGPVPAFAANAASFALSALLLVGLAVPRAQRDGEARAAPLRELGAGLRWIAGSAFARALLGVLALVMVAGALKTPVEPIFVLDVLGARPEALGLVGALWGLGMIAGAAVSPAANRRWGCPRVLSAGIAAVGLAMLGSAPATAIGVVLALWGLAGAGNAVGMIANETLLQELTPAAVRGRVFAAFDAVTDAAFLCGALAGGALGAAVGIRGALVACGTLFLLAASWLVLLAPRARVDRAAAGLPDLAPEPAKG
jgi:MFS family permease